MVQQSDYEKNQHKRRAIEAILKIGSCGVGEYLVEFKAPHIQASTTTHFPISGREAHLLEMALNDIPFAGTPLQKTPQTGTPILEDFGRLFFETVFKNGVDDALKQCLERAVREDRQLRIRLELLDPEFSALPLEFLFDTNQQAYLCLNPRVALVRTPVQTQAIHPFKVKPPLNILAVLSAPRDERPLDALQEKEAIMKALAPLEAQGLVSITWVESWEALKGEIHGKKPWHIFHLIGHGLFDAGAEECFIGMVDAHGHTHLISGQQLANLLKMQKSLRLAFLNFCEGGKAGTQNLFSSAAVLLWLQGIQAVAALQADISNEAAKTLTEMFYGQLAQGTPVDVAFTLARREISFQAAHTLEWGTLVLYLSSIDTVLFDVIGDRPTSGAPARGAQEWLEEGKDYHGKNEEELQQAMAQQDKLREKLAEHEAFLAEHTSLPRQMERIELLMELGEYERAVEACKQTLNEWSTAGPLVKQKLYTVLGNAYLGLGEIDEAESAYERAAYFKPEGLS